MSKTQQEPTTAVVDAANELRAMHAYQRLAAAATAATSALEASAAAGGGGPGGAASAAAAAAAARVPEEACKAVVRRLHRSGVGSMVFAGDMERYLLLGSPEQRSVLLAGGSLAAVAREGGMWGWAGLSHSRLALGGRL